MKHCTPLAPVQAVWPGLVGRKLLPVRFWELLATTEFFTEPLLLHAPQSNDRFADQVELVGTIFGAQVGQAAPPTVAVAFYPCGDESGDSRETKAQSTTTVDVSATGGGVVSGAEMLTNGSFTGSLTGWIVGSGWTPQSNAAGQDGPMLEPLSQAGLSIVNHAWPIAQNWYSLFGSLTEIMAPFFSIPQLILTAQLEAYDTGEAESGIALPAPIKARDWIDYDLSTITPTSSPTRRASLFHSPDPLDTHKFRLDLIPRVEPPDPALATLFVIDDVSLKKVTPYRFSIRKTLAEVGQGVVIGVKPSGAMADTFINLQSRLVFPG